MNAHQALAFFTIRKTTIQFSKNIPHLILLCLAELIACGLSIYDSLSLGFPDFQNIFKILEGFSKL
jgi:hypothetical protein